MTPFGKFLRRLRIERNMILKDMADDLGVKVSFLSGVEHARHPVPDDWPQRIAEKYNLSGEEQNVLYYVLAGLDQRDHMLKHPGKWSLAFKNENNRWVKIGFDRAEMMAIKAPMKLDIPADSMCPGISYPNAYEIDNAVPIDEAFDNTEGEKR